MLDARVRHGAFAPRAAARTWRARRMGLVGVALLCLAMFGVQLAVSACIAGSGQALALVSGDIAALRMDRVQAALVLASGVLPALAIAYAMPRIVLDGIGLRAALAENMRMLHVAWRPVGLVTAVTMAMVAALVWQPLLMLILLPGGFVLGYAMVRDAFPAP